MFTNEQGNSYRCVFSLKPLVDYWNHMTEPTDRYAVGVLNSIQTGLVNAPELLKPMDEFSALDSHRELMRALMSAVFPHASWDTELVGALVPFTMRPVFVSPKFQHLLLNADGSFRGTLHVEREEFVRARLIRLVLLILRRCYGIERDFDYHLIRTVIDPETGLERLFQFKPDFQFVQVKAVGPLPSFTDRELSSIMMHIGEPEVLQEFFPPGCFEFHGFTAIHAVDVTVSEVISGLGRDLIDERSIVSREGFSRVQERLRTILGRPDIVVGLAAIQNEQVLMLNNGCEMTHCCIFADSRHLPLAAFSGSVFERATKDGGIFIVGDLKEEPELTSVDKQLLAFGIRSFIVAPLFFQGKLIGTLDLGSPKPYDFGLAEDLVLNQIRPLFAMALKRSLDEFEHHVEAVIKEKCTAVHPSVEWCFRRAALRHLDSSADAKSEELEPIVFKDVYALYGATDIRGSSEARNRAIQSDLVEHLSLALEIALSAEKDSSLPILGEVAYRTQGHLDRIRSGLSTGDQTSILKFLRNELEPLFPLLRSFGTTVTQRIEAYEMAMDANMGMVYRERRDYEQSISLFNQRIAAYFDREEVRAQSVFPHYFNKHQTDGLDYIIYLGASMVENGLFDALYVRNLRLWQLTVACGIAWHSQDISTSLKVPLEATHLILVHHRPMSIRFRFDEKRFDVDGAYDVGHEIIRARIDKATVKGTNERMTQPGKIAIVYSRLNEREEMAHHINFLQHRGYLNDDLEFLELDDLPGVQGLRALRIGVNLQSPELIQRASRIVS